ncbi:acetate/propionate family kinase [Modestobacter marinus]|uniref:Acetate kinase n=1 Tax=Modestobacter marinus TaxID=477641 RepID=A0ABQ2G6F2_9ACTN|nr:acetate kinase [Modestobacter marinus]GGL77011.1 acetate kinase [Modestobacter marinus]
MVEPARPVVLALNVGSSSLRAALRVPELRVRAHAAELSRAAGELALDGPGGGRERIALPDGWDSALPALAGALASRAPQPDVVVHRIVLGSDLLVGPRPADGALLARLRAESHRAPLHLPRQLDVVDRARRCWPGARIVLCPDSGFHRQLPDEAEVLPLPPDARASGLRRWGFHGLAVQSVVDRLPDLGPAVVVHLGSGCSVTAVADGRPRHTTMAISPAGGVPSLTRSGDLDPEVVLQLLEATGGDVDAVRRTLNQRSGVAGLSGGRTDVRELLRAADASADLALRVFVRDVAMAVAAAVTALDRWDAVVFTGGIGAGSAVVRDLVCARLLSLRQGAAGHPGPPAAQLAASGVRVVVEHVDEEAVMDRLARAVLRGDAAGPDGAAPVARPR